MKFIERFIERKFKRRLYKKRQIFLNKAIEDFVRDKNPTPETLETFKKRLTDEADRVYTIVDRSVLKARIKAASKTFWIGTIASIIIIGVCGAFTGGTILPFITPVLAAFVAWLIYLGTTPYFYNQRVQAGLDTVVLAVRKEMDSAEDKFDIKKCQAQINTIESTLVNIINKLNSQSQNNSSTDTNPVLKDIHEIKTSLNTVVNQVSHLNQKVDNLYAMQSINSFSSFLNQNQFNQEEETFKQIAQLFFLSTANVSNNQHQFFASPKSRRIREVPAIFIEKDQGRLQPVSNNPVLKAIETNQVYQFQMLMQNIQDILKLSTLEVISKHTSKTGYTLLHYAAAYGAADVVNYLLEQGMDSEAKNENSETALDIAIKAGYKDTIVVLAQHARKAKNDFYPSVRLANTQYHD